MTVGSISSVTIRVAWPAVPPSSRMVASSSRRSVVVIAAVLISASVANAAARPTISQTPHAPSTLEAWTVSRYCVAVQRLHAGMVGGIARERSLGAPRRR